MRKKSTVTLIFLTLVILVPITSVSASLSFFGSNYNPPFEQYAVIYNTIRGSSFLTPADMGVVTSISALIYNPPTGSSRPAQAAIYTEGEEHQLVAVSGEVTIGCDTYDHQWITFPLLSNPKLSPNTYYVLVVWAGGEHSGTYPRIYYTAGSFAYQGHSFDCNGNPAYPTAPYGYNPNNMPTPIPATYNGNPYFDENKIKYSIYCSYIPSGSSGTIITAYSPVSLLLTDSASHRVGFDPTTNSTVNEITGATYTGPNTEPQIIVLPDLIGQAYSLQFFGTAQGSYTVTVDTVSGDGATMGTKTWTGTTDVNQLFITHFITGSDGSVIEDEPPVNMVPEVPFGTILILVCFGIAFTSYSLRRKTNS
jgi:hypothetical protein